MLCSCVIGVNLVCGEYLGILEFVLEFFLLRVKVLLDIEMDSLIVVIVQVFVVMSVLEVVFICDVCGWLYSGM